MSYRGNQPLLAQAMAPYTGQATSGQSYIPVPGGVVPGMNIVGVGGAWLAPGDFSDLDGAGISLTVPMAAGTQWIVIAFSQNTSYVPVGGQLAGFRNQFINGNLDIWQRGASVVTGNNFQAGNAAGYGPDRWWMQVYAGSGGSGTSSCSMTRQAFALGQTAVPGEPAYYARFQPAAVGTQGGTGSVIHVLQRIEGVRTFAGQQITLSGLLKADAARTYAVQVYQYFGSGGSPSANVLAYEQLLNVGATFGKVSIPVNVPSIAGKTIGTNGDDCLVVDIIMYKQDNTPAGGGALGAIGTWSATPYLDMSQWQVESGGVATAFERRPLGTELALCQRYYWRRTSVAVDEKFGACGFAVNSTLVHLSMKLPVPMRVKPTIAAANVGASTAGGTTILANTISDSGSNPEVLAFNLGMSSASFTSGNGTVGVFTSAGSWIDANAEL
jgi:hypothetical protein